MNKIQITQISIGGVAALGALALGYMTWSAWSNRGEAEEDIEFLQSDAARLSHQKVYPQPAALEALAENRVACSNWLDLARTTVSVGDRRFEPTTPPAFKAFLVAGAKRLAEKPGAENGKFVKEGFGFGFDDFVNKGKLPSVADLPRLQREWSDVETVVEILADAGATSVTDLALVRPADEELQKSQPRTKKTPPKGKKPSAADVQPPDVTRFTVVFTADAGSLVKALNQLAAETRFIVVEAMSFARLTDEIGTKLGAKVKEESASSRRRRRAAAAAIQASAADNEPKGGNVSDPQRAVDLKVTLTVAVYDFHMAPEKTASENDASDASEAKKEGEAEE